MNERAQQHAAVLPPLIALAVAEIGILFFALTVRWLLRHRQPDIHAGSDR